MVNQIISESERNLLKTQYEIKGIIGKYEATKGLLDVLLLFIEPQLVNEIWIIYRGCDILIGT